MKIRKEYLPKEINLQLVEPFLNDLEKKIDLYYQLYGAKLYYTHEVEYDSFGDFYSAIDENTSYPKKVGVSVFFHKDNDSSKAYEVALFIDVDKDRILLSSEGSKGIVTSIEKSFQTLFQLEDKREEKMEKSDAKPVNNTSKDIGVKQQKDNKKWLDMNNPVTYFIIAALIILFTAAINKYIF